MEFYFLWSDYCVYFLLLISILLGLRIYQNKRLRLKWHRVISRPLNMIAAIILIVYCLVGVLDSIHFKADQTVRENTGNSVVSLLDKVLSPLLLQVERSYSAPFSLFAFSKESITLPNGQIIRDYPRLQYGGAHLTNPKDKKSDILHRLFVSFLQSVILAGAFSVIVLIVGLYQSKLPWEIFWSQVRQGKRQFPWRSFLLTVWTIIFLCVLISNYMSYYHILGTNQVGEDVLYQTLKSIRTGLIIGTFTTIVMLPFAILLGMAAGFFGGWVDDFIQYLYTTLSSIPGVLLIAAAVLALQMVMDRHADWFESMLQRSDARLLALCVILGITSWTSLCRLLRAETLKLSQMDYITAAHSLGVSPLRILLNHLLPNILHLILITIVLDFSGLVLAEAVLSYVGVGVDPSSYSWGIMINSARLELARIPVIWWSLVAAFIFMFMLVLAANIFSDALRDTFDPHNLGVK